MTDVTRFCIRCHLPYRPARPSRARTYCPTCTLMEFEVLGLLPDCDMVFDPPVALRGGRVLCACGRAVTSFRVLRSLPHLEMAAEELERCGYLPRGGAPVAAALLTTMASVDRAVTATADILGEPAPVTWVSTAEEDLRQWRNEQRLRRLAHEARLRDERLYPSSSASPAPYRLL